MTEKQLKNIESKSVTTPADLIAMAVSQNADIDKLEKLLQLQERYEANEAKKAFIQARSGFSGESIIILKTKEGHNGKYATLSNELEIVTPLLSKHGLSHCWNTKQGNNVITVTCILTHVLGHSESTSLESCAETSGNKNNIQAIGSAVSYLKRYTFESICGLASKDDDDGKKSGKPTNQKKRAPTISQDVKDLVYADTIRYLDALDDVGVKETLSGFENDEKLVLWGMFNSVQRKAINAAIKKDNDNG